MPTVSIYSDNIYTDEYYLAQYVLLTVYIKKKYCILLLTPKEVQMLQERMPELTYEKLYEINNSDNIAYQIHKE